MIPWRISADISWRDVREGFPKKSCCYFGFCPKYLPPPSPQFGQLVQLFFWRRNSRFEGQFRTKHCQRHNGPEGWVLITKVSYLGHITSSQTNLDQISSSKSWLNIASESRPRIIFIIATKGQQQNIDLTSASKSFAKILRAKSGQKFVFMTKLQLLSINTSNSNNLNKFWVGIFTSQGHINQVY